MVNESGRKRLPPYVSYRTFRNFIDQMGPRPPARIDRSVWGPMLSGSSGGHLMAALRFLDLIDPNEQPTVRLKSLIAARGNNEQRARVLHAVIDECYAFVFTGVDNAQDLTYSQMEEKFFAHFPLKPDVGRKCLKFFFELSSDAGIPQSPYWTKRFRSGHSASGTRTPPKRPSTRTITKTASPGGIRGKPVPSNPDDTPGVTGWKMVYDKFPSFDPAWSEELQSKWFTALTELMKRFLSQPED